MAAMEPELDDTYGDDVLVAAVVSGDRDAFAMLMRRHMPLVMATTQRLMANPADADEAVQETFLRLWRHADSYRNDGGARLSTWLYRIASNVCYDRLRRRSETLMAELPETVDSAPDALDQLTQAQQASAVTEAVERLPERQRQAVELCYYQGLTAGVAAERLGLTLKATEALLVRGRKRLRDWLGEHHPLKGG
jgi:RNA polymerase sigma-70 factor, ECF subfamily